MFKNYFKFIFVWEFFEWFFFVYKDKFVYIWGIDYWMLKFYGWEIFKYVWFNVIEYVCEKFDDIIFKEFVEYLVIKGSNESSLIMDWYWDNYLYICGMCVVKYDFIGYYEIFN